MHSDRKAADVPQKSSDVPPIDIYETLPQLRTKKQRQLKPEQVSPKRNTPASRCGAVPSDLDRIAHASCETEVLDVAEQVLQVLHRSGRMAEIPASLRLDRLSTSAELRMAMQRMQGARSFVENVDWHSDAMLVLRAVLSAGDEKLKERRWRR